MVGVLGCEFVEDCPLCATMELNILAEPAALPVFAQTQLPLSLSLSEAASVPSRISQFFDFAPSKWLLFLV